MRFISILLILLLIEVKATSQDTAKIFLLKNGLEDPTKEQKKLIPTGKPPSQAAINLKPNVDLSPYLSSPGYQGEVQGSCSAFVVGFGIKTIQENIKNNRKNISLTDDLILSPAYIFNRAKQIKGAQNDCGRGITLIEALFVLKDEGTVPLSIYKYYPFDPDGCKNDVPTAILPSAKKYRISSFDAPELNKFDFQLALSKNYPIALAIKIDHKFIRDGFKDIWSDTNPFIWKGYSNNTETDRVRHAVLCVGYDDKLKAFKILNSWGDKFGNKGFFWIDYDFMFKATYDAYIAIDRADGQKDIEVFKSMGAGPSDNSMEQTEFSSWIKAGYFRDFDGFRIGCVFLSKGNNIVTIQITDIDKNKILNRIDLNVGQQKEFEYEGFKHIIKLNRIGNTGINVFKQAAFFSYFRNRS